MRTRRTPATPGTSPVYARTQADVRRMLRDAVLSTPELADTLNESRVFVGPESDGASYAHGLFSILNPATTNLEAERGRAGLVLYMRNDVTVRVCHRARNSDADQLLDYDELVGEWCPAIVRRLMGFSGPHLPGINVQHTAIDCVLAGSGSWFLADVQFTADYQFTLEGS